MVNYTLSQTLVFNRFVDTPPSGELPSIGGEIITNRCLSVNFPTFLLVVSHDRKGPNKHFCSCSLANLWGSRNTLLTSSMESGLSLIVPL
jgi:hypothetical protein